MTFRFIDDHRTTGPCACCAGPWKSRPPATTPGGSGPAGSAGAAATRLGRGDPGDPCRGQGPLRQPTHPRRAGGTRPRLLRQHRGQADAGQRHPGQDRTEVPLHDHGLQPRLARGGERPGPAVRPPRLPMRSWVADITYIPTRRGLALPGGRRGSLLAAGRRLVDGRPHGEPPGGRCLELAVQRRLPGEGLLAHSDRGSQYASEHYQSLLGQVTGSPVSMSGRGDCWDNAPMESFFASLKKELVHDATSPPGRKPGRASSSTSRCSTTTNAVTRSLGYVSPAEYEQSE